MWEREDCGTTGSGCRSSNGLLLKLLFLNRGWRRGDDCRGIRLRNARLDIDDGLVGEFPAEIFLLAVLFVVLFEVDGAAGIGYETSRGGQTDITGTIKNFHATPKKCRKTGHTEQFVGAEEGGSIVRKIGRKKLVWKSEENRSAANEKL